MTPYEFRLRSSGFGNNVVESATSKLSSGSKRSSGVGRDFGEPSPYANIVPETITGFRSVMTSAGIDALRSADHLRSIVGSITFDPLTRAIHKQIDAITLPGQHEALLPSAVAKTSQVPGSPNLSGVFAMAADMSANSVYLLESQAVMAHTVLGSRLGLLGSVADDIAMAAIRSTKTVSDKIKSWL